MVAPTSPMSLVMDRTADLIASSTTWQTTVGEINEADAKNHVHLVGIGGEEIGTTPELSRPYAIVTIDEYILEQFKGKFCTPGVRFWFETPITPSLLPSRSDPVLEHMNIVGEVVKEMIENSEQGGRQIVRTIQFVEVQRARIREAIGARFVVSFWELDAGTNLRG